MIINTTIKSGSSDKINMINLIHFQVYDPSAGFTKEMIVWMGIAIKVVKAVTAVKPQSFVVFYEKIQITVNRSKTDIWKIFFYILLSDVRW